MERADAQSILDAEKGLGELSMLRGVPEADIGDIPKHLEEVSQKKKYWFVLGDILFFFITSNKISELINSYFPPEIKQSQVLIIVSDTIKITSVHDTILAKRLDASWTAGAVPKDRRMYHVSSTLQLRVNPMSNRLTPKHELMTADQVQAEIFERGLNPKDLKKILLTDAVMKWIGGRVGQVVRITREIDVDYRVVIKC